MDGARRRRGKPPLRDGDPSCGVYLRVEGSLYDRIYVAARLQRQTVNDYIRAILRASTAQATANSDGRMVSDP